MEIETAQKIVDLMNCSPRELLPIIRLLRAETGLGLINAKQYLEQNHIRKQLFSKLCDDYVQNPEDLLLLAYQRRDALNEEIAKLEGYVTSEKAQELIDILKDGAVTLVEALSTRRNKDWSEGPLFAGNLIDPRPVVFTGVSSNNVEY